MRNKYDIKKMKLKANPYLMTEFSNLFELEQQLHSHEVRSNLEKLSALLSTQFFEFGSSGTIWSRDDVLKRVPSENENIQIESSNYNATLLSQGVVLVTYLLQKSEAGEAPITSLRSSIWKDYPDRWKMEFHQATLKNS